MPNTDLIVRIPTSAGLLIITEEDNQSAWRTPNGSAGLADNLDDAIAEAFKAEALNPSDYGY